jgi:hypothetical protein
MKQQFQIDYENKRQANEAKAELMAEKFINVFEYIDCFKKWEVILLERIIKRLQKNGEDMEGITATLELSFGLKVFQVDSIAQEMKIDEFLEQLKENPYQLKLVS